MCLFQASRVLASELFPAGLFAIFGTTHAISNPTRQNPEDGTELIVLRRVLEVETISTQLVMNNRTGWYGLCICLRR